MGLEPTPEYYVANLVAVFREVRRMALGVTASYVEARRPWNLRIMDRRKANELGAKRFKTREIVLVVKVKGLVIGNGYRAARRRIPPSRSR